MSARSFSRWWRGHSLVQRAQLQVAPLVLLGQLAQCRPVVITTTREPALSRRPLPRPSVRPLVYATEVQKGESLATIATRIHGDPSRWPEIYALNQDRIGEDPSMIRPGQRLVLYEPVTETSLLQVMRDLAPELATVYLPHLNLAMWEFGITTNRRKACFLSQLAHESGQLRHFEEIASGEAYEGRQDLGNVQQGDGVRYKGRGPIQLTGRKNYGLAGQVLGLDLLAEPELVATAEVGFRVAGWFFHDNGLNELCDRERFSEITRRINGGSTVGEERERFYKLARAAFPE